MTPDELEKRTRQFALRVIRLVDALPNTVAGRSIGGQLVRSAMSTAANYRAARRGRSKKEFTAKIGIVLEEADESEFWLGMIIDAKLIDGRRVAPLRREAGDLMRIFAATRRTASRTNRQTAKSPDR